MLFTSCLQCFGLFTAREGTTRELYKEGGGLIGKGGV